MLHPTAWQMGGGSTHGCLLVLGAWTMHGLDGACVQDLLIHGASEEPWHSMERDTLLGTVTLEELWGSVERGTVPSEAGRVLAVLRLSCPCRFPHLILVPSLSLCFPAARRSSKYLACFFLFFGLLLFTC